MPKEPETKVKSDSVEYVSSKQKSVIDKGEPLHLRNKPGAHVIHFIESLPTEHYPSAHLISHFTLKYYH